MKPSDFIRTAEVQHILEQTALFAAVPVSVHFLNSPIDNKPFSAGGCEACRLINQSKEGKQICREARREAGATAFELGAQYPFTCPFGFACIIIPIIPEDNGFFLTIGPFITSEAASMLELVCQKELEPYQKRDAESDEPIPVSFQDVRIVPAITIPTILQWGMDQIRALWEKVILDEEIIPIEDPASAEDPEMTASSRSNRGTMPTVAPYLSTTIAAALIAGDLADARQTAGRVLRRFTGSPPHLKTPLALMRPRSVALGAATMEALERARVDVSNGWACLKTLHEQVAKATTPDEVLDYVEQFLRAIRRVIQKTDQEDPIVKTIHAYVDEHINESITLNEVAPLLGLHPTAITHHLQKILDMSFTQYVGRLRVENAKRLLEQTQLDCSEIGKRVGVRDVSNFVKLFKKFEHMTPLQYRERSTRR